MQKRVTAREKGTENSEDEGEEDKVICKDFRDGGLNLPTS